MVYALRLVGKPNNATDRPEILHLIVSAANLQQAAICASNWLVSIGRTPTSFMLDRGGSFSSENSNV